MAFRHTHIPALRDAPHDAINHTLNPTISHTISVSGERFPGGELVGLHRFPPGHQAPGVQKVSPTEMRVLLEHMFEQDAHTGGMAGGMSSRRGVPLRDRPVNLGDGKGDDQAKGRGQRHCWVHGPPEDPGPHAGLIQTWRHGPQGWSALVIYIIAGEPGREVTTIQRWVPASWLSPA